MLTCSPKKVKPDGACWAVEVSVMDTAPPTGLVMVVLSGSEELAVPSPVAVESVPPAATSELALSTG